MAGGVRRSAARHVDHRSSSTASPDGRSRCSATLVTATSTTTAGPVASASVTPAARPYLNGKLVTVTSYSLTNDCRYLGGYQRVDIPVVRDPLATFGVRSSKTCPGSVPGPQRRLGDHIVW